MIDPSRHAVLWLLIAFVFTTAATRTTTRYIRHKADRAEAYLKENAEPGLIRNIVVAGIHVHHQVWGILMVLFSGLLLITYLPERGLALNVLAALFGMGAALTLDEFAMWLHLDDVYWQEEGRQSVTALIVAVTITAALVIGANPLDVVPTGNDLPGALLSALGIVNLGFVVVTILKGKLPTGLVGVFVPLVGIIGAVRVAKPGSWWARRRYKEDGWLARRAERRFDATYDARWNAIRDIIGGRPYPREQMREAVREQMKAVRVRRQELPLERAQARVARQARRRERLGDMPGAAQRTGSTRAGDEHPPEEP